MLEEVISISHGKDLDGVACAALVYRRFGKCKILWTEPQLLYKTLKGVLTVKNAKIIISDLGPNKATIKHVIAYLKRLKGNNNEIYWFDHHVWDARIRSEVSRLIDLLVVDTRKCAAQITYENLLPKDAVAGELASIACDSDFWIHKYPISRRLEKVTSSSIDKLYLVRTLAKGEFWNRTFEKYYKARAAMESKILQEALKNIKEYTVCSKYKLAIITGNYPASLIGEKLAGKYHVIAVVSPRGGVSLRRGFNNINLLPIAERLQGGGHPFAAGGTLNYSPIDKLLAKVGYYRKLNVIVKAVKDTLEDVLCCQDGLSKS